MERDTVVDEEEACKDEKYVFKGSNNIQRGSFEKTRALGRSPRGPLGVDIWEGNDGVGNRGPNIKDEMLGNAFPATNVETSRQIKQLDEMFNQMRVVNGNSKKDQQTLISRKQHFMSPTISSALKKREKSFFRQKMAKKSNAYLCNCGARDWKQLLIDEHIEYFNSYSKEELMSIPGIGEVRAEDIIWLRDNTQITSLKDLEQIEISDKIVRGIMAAIAKRAFD